MQRLSTLVLSTRHKPSRAACTGAEMEDMPMKSMEKKDVKRHKATGVVTKIDNDKVTTTASSPRTGSDRSERRSTRVSIHEPQ